VEAMTMSARLFADNTCPHEMPLDQADLVERWSAVLREPQLESLARWARDAKVGDTRRVGMVVLTCVRVTIEHDE
jgi:hypothetical protein